MTAAPRLKQLAPYVVTLIGGVILYAIADRIAFTPIPDQIGPEVWPKIVIVLMIGVSVFEICRRLFVGAAAVVSEDVQAQEPWLANQGDHPRLVFGAVAATVVYLLALDVVGFTIGTFVYVALIMWFGGTKRPLLVLGMSAAITLTFAFVFTKLIFVALPVGQEPFSRVSYALMSLMGL